MHSARSRHIVSLWSLNTETLSHFENPRSRTLVFFGKQKNEEPGVQQKWSRIYGGSSPPLFPNLHFNGELMAGANSELVDVSQRGHTSPSVSIIAARQVSLSDPHGEPPFWIRGDAPLPPWPLETSRGNWRIWHCSNDLNPQNIIRQSERKPPQGSEGCNWRMERDRVEITGFLIHSLLQSHYESFSLNRRRGLIWQTQLDPV